MQTDLQVPHWTVLCKDLGTVSLIGFLANTHAHMVRDPRGHFVKMSLGVTEMECLALLPTPVSMSQALVQSGDVVRVGSGAKQMRSVPLCPRPFALR